MTILPILNKIKYDYTTNLKKKIDYITNCT